MPTCAVGRCEDPAKTHLVLAPFGTYWQLWRRAIVNAQTGVRHKHRHGCESRGILGVLQRGAGEMAFERPSPVFVLPGQQVFLNARDVGRRPLSESLVVL